MVHSLLPLTGVPTGRHPCRRAQLRMAAWPACTTAGPSGPRGVVSTCRRPMRGVPVPPRANLSAVAVAERYGLVWLCPGEPVAPIPEMAVDSDPSFRRINTGVAVWRVSAPRMVDNFLDIAHFPYVHRGTFGGAQEPRVPSIDLVDLDDGYHGYRYEVVARNPEEAQVSSGSDATRWWGG